MTVQITHWCALGYIMWGSTLLRAFKNVRCTYCTGGPKPTATFNNWGYSSPEIVHKRCYEDTGKLYFVHHAMGNSTIPLVHLYGTSYEMGVAHGTLLKEQILAMYTAYWEYLRETLPGKSDDSVEQLLLPIEQASASFIPIEFSDELRGLAHATGVYTLF